MLCIFLVNVNKNYMILIINNKLFIVLSNIEKQQKNILFFNLYIKI